jgi:hypothetical protein
MNSTQLINWVRHSLGWARHQRRDGQDSAGSDRARRAHSLGNGRAGIRVRPFGLWKGITIQRRLSLLRIAVLLFRALV